MLKHKDDGSCWYLGDGGCTIWDRAPLACRAFDCRIWYEQVLANYTRSERRQMLGGYLDKDVFEAGKKRLKTL